MGKKRILNEDIFFGGRGGPNENVVSPQFVKLQFICDEEWAKINDFMFVRTTV